MDDSGQSARRPIRPQDLASSDDPRLNPTPGYGNLGPGSDAPGQSNSNPRPAKSNTWGQLIAVALGMAVAVLIMTSKASRSNWAHLAELIVGRGQTPSSVTAGVTQDQRQIDRLQPQQQAETLLERAVAHSESAVEQIATRADRWRGQIQWDSQIATLTTAALNSPDLQVRKSGVEVELAAYGLAKDSSSLEYVLKASDSPDHAQKIWALWALGLMGNRGVETDRVVETLSFHLKDNDEESRRWAVDGLALVGTPETLPMLLQVMHDDAAPSVRERAACGIAESGMFTPEQRLSAVPQLLSYTDDLALDAQTHAWAFQALSDITRQHLPNDPAAWRSWYEATKN
jgi:hypothetical protein